MIAPLSQSYRDARHAFLEAARAADARVDSFPHPLKGLEHEALFIDVAEIGPAAANSIAVVVSGTHGVEGYLGSALQRHHLETLGGHPEGTALVFIHALNPYGFSWVRRVNEDNVDLNRNFIDWSQPVPRNGEYDAYADMLVPDSWSAHDQERTGEELLTALAELGFDHAQQVISGGQFAHPTGIFYGGAEPTWSHRWLRDFMNQRLTDVDRAAIVDLHTGLGSWGDAELISSELPGSAELARQRHWWGEVTALRGNDSVSSDLAGEWLGATSTLAPNTEVTGIAIEYGTVDPLVVVDSLRADAVMHAGGAQTSPGAADIRAQVRAAFVDDDPAWLETCWPAYDRVVTTALQRLQSS